MRKVQFIEDFDYKPMPQQTVAYKAGEVYVVTEEIANFLFENNLIQNAPDNLETAPSGINENINKYKVGRKNSRALQEEASKPSEDPDDVHISQDEPKIVDAPTAEEILEDPTFVNERKE